MIFCSYQKVLVAHIMGGEPVNTALGMVQERSGFTHRGCCSSFDTILFLGEPLHGTLPSGVISASPIVFHPNSLVVISMQLVKVRLDSEITQKHAEFHFQCKKIYLLFFLGGGQKIRKTRTAIDELNF